MSENNFEVGNGDGGDTLGAVGFFLAELAKGPFAPALAGDVLACYHITVRLSDFLRRNLSEKVILISRQDLSPVGRPALALIDKLRDPKYWACFRLSSLHRVWDSGVVDMSALDRVPVPNHRFRRYSLELEESDLADFESSFKIGSRMRGRIVRRASSGAGLIVEVIVNGSSHSCFLPLETLPVEARNNALNALLGKEGDFEVLSTLPTKRSVWLRLVHSSESAPAPSVSEQVIEGSSKNELLEELERKLIFVRRLHDQGLLPDAEYEAKRRELLDRI